MENTNNNELYTNTQSVNPERGENEKKNDGRLSGKALAFILVVTILLSSSFGALFGFMAGNAGQALLSRQGLSQILNNKNISDVSSERQRVIQEDSAVIDVVDKSSPAVVSIIISKDIPRVRSFFDNPFNFPGFGPFGESEDGTNQNQEDTEKQQVGGGSGFIVSADGMIVTNKHVASDTAADYTVITNDGKEHSAKVLAKDPTNDIAVIKIEGTDYPTLNFGDSNSVKIGQTVIAIGNSLGEFSNTVSRGIISGLKRNVTAGNNFGETERLTNIIQTDAAINPGNSGGPLLNMNGDVIGINVAMAQGAQNIGFAIPGNSVQRVVDQVKTLGRISVPYLGIRYVPVDALIQKENNLPYNYGALVLRGQRMTDFAVIPGSPADKAGLSENDIILEINGARIDDKNGLSDLLAQHNVGEEVTLKIWHRGEEKEVKVKLEERK